MASKQTAFEAFLQSRPTEYHLRAQVCPKVGHEWRALSTYLNIPTTMVDKLLESHKHDVNEAFFRVLCLWRESEGASWDQLLKAMREAKLNAPVRELQEWMSSGLPPPVTEQSPTDLLKEKVYKEYQGFKIGTKREKKGHKSSADYVKLAVLEKPPSSKPDNVEDKMEAMHRFKHCGARVAHEKASHITPVDFLQKGSERIRVVYGQAGSGKTTLLKQMCRALSCDEAESDFKLVLYFPLRDRSVSSASDLRSLLSYYLHDEDPANVSAMVRSLKENKNLLMVFDGADEVKGLLESSSGSIVHRILQGRILPEAHIIISSRPGACPSLQDHSASFYEVQGFDHAAITSYVKGFFGATPSAAGSMLSQLETRPDLMGGAYIPMNSFILCSIFDPKSASFPATMTACYQAFVRQTIIRECRNKGRDLPLDPLLQYTTLPEDIRCLLVSLGALAFKGLSQVPPMFIFNEYSSTRSEPSIRSTFPQELLPLSAPIDEYLFKGLLHMHASREGFGAQHSFSFPHGTQQEFFAAFHLSLLTEDEQVQFWRENLFNTSFSVVLRFHAGLTRLCSPQVAKEICSSLTGAPQGGNTSHSIGECSNDYPQLLFLFHALCESQIPLTEEMKKHIPSSLGFRLSLSAFDTKAIAHCLSQCSHLKLLNLASPCILLSPQCLSHLSEVLQSTPDQDCQLKGTLDLHCDHLSAGDAQTLADIAVSLREVFLSVSQTECTALSTLCSLPSVTCLEVTVRSDVEAKDDSGWPLVESSLASNKELKHLRLEGCDVLLLTMAKAVTKNTSLRTLSLARAPLPDDVACAIGTCVAAMTQLRMLVMHDLSLHVTKSLADRREPLEDLTVYPPGVNWDGINEEQWKKAKEAIAMAKVKVVYLVFNDKSTERRRAIQAVTAGLSSNMFIEEITMCGVPQEMREAVKDKLHSSSMRVNVYS